MIGAKDEASPLPERLDGFFRGKVEVNEGDPLKLGRCRVRVYPWFADITAAELPWCMAANPLGSTGVDMGTQNVPDVGSWVWCFFEDGDPMQPNMFASAPASTQAGTVPMAPGEAHEATAARSVGKRTSYLAALAARGFRGLAALVKPAYPRNRVWKTKSGHLLEVDETDGAKRLHVYHPAGSFFEIYDNGDQVRHTNGELFEVVAKVWNIEVPKLLVNGHPLILGDLFMQMFLAHIHPTGTGPSGPPVKGPSPLPGSMTPDMLSGPVDPLGHPVG